jgi:GT2 family glycosyltransferase
MNVLVIPAFLRAEWDRACLQRLAASAARQPYLDAVVVVDDASPFTPAELPSRVDVIRLSVNGGPARARNVGIVRALGLGADHILFTDHDCVLDPGWATALSSFLAGGTCGAVGGVTAALGDTLLDRFHDFNGTLNGRWVLPAREELLYAPTCNLAITAGVAREFKFDERYPTAAGEDVDFCLRLRRRHRIGFCPDAVLRHDFGYVDSVRGLGRFIRTLKKYRAANALLWSEHSGLLWTDSEAIPSEVA